MLTRRWTVMPLGLARLPSRRPLSRTRSVGQRAELEQLVNDALGKRDLEVKVPEAGDGVSTSASRVFRCQVLRDPPGMSPA